MPPSPRSDATRRLHVIDTVTADAQQDEHVSTSNPTLLISSHRCWATTPRAPSSLELTEAAITGHRLHCPSFYSDVLAGVPRPRDSSRCILAHQYRQVHVQAIRQRAGALGSRESKTATASCASALCRFTGAGGRIAERANTRHCPELGLLVSRGRDY